MKSSDTLETKTVSPKGIDWRQIGRFVAVIVKLFSHIVEVFKRIGVGPEILEWVTGDGKKVFEKEFLTPLAIRFGPKDRFIVVNMEREPDSRTEEDNHKYAVGRHDRAGTVVIERRGDDLLADGQKLSLYFSPHRNKGKITDIGVLYSELWNRRLPNVNIIYSLFDNTFMIPESWENYGGIHCLGTTWGRRDQDPQDPSRITQIRSLHYWPEEKYRGWTVESNFFHCDAGNYPVLVYED